MRRQLKNRNIRKLYKHSSSYALTIPLEIIKDLKWKEKQKLVVKKKGKKIIIEDWE